MAWYDTIVDIKNTAVDFLKSDTVQDIAGAADYFLGGGDSGKSQQTTILQAYWRYYLTSVGRMSTGTTGGQRRTRRV
jgi:hypothetical protein